MKRILSVLLVAVTLVGAIVGFLPTPAVHVFAAEALTEGYVTATENALKTSYKSYEDKIANDPSLQKMLTAEAENGQTYSLYCNSYTGEVIYYNEDTKEALSTNPYDVGGDKAISDTVKAQLLSQVSVAYKGTDGARKVMYSFTEAAQRGQIQVKNIKNGIRVQYTMGRENPIFLMPGWITVARFEEEIKGPLDAYVAEIEALSGDDIKGYREKLKARIQEALADSNITVDENRLLTECAIYADKVAIDEELVRLRSHFGAFEKIAASGEPAGRKLDFLIQEMNRETNTIGSKCCDSRIAHKVVDIKTELEKIREQIQNIE